MQRHNLQELCDRFIAYGAVIRNYKPMTISNYKGTFNIFFSETDVKYLDELNKQMIEKWFFDSRLKRKWNPATFRHRHKHFNVFFKWLIKEKLLQENYVAEMEKPKLEQRLPRTLNHNEAQIVLDASFHLSYRYKGTNTKYVLQRILFKNRKG